MLTLSWWRSVAERLIKICLYSLGNNGRRVNEGTLSATVHPKDVRIVDEAEFQADLKICDLENVFLDESLIVLRAQVTPEFRFSVYPLGVWTWSRVSDPAHGAPSQAMTVGRSRLGGPDTLGGVSPHETEGHRHPFG